MKDDFAHREFAYGYFEHQILRTQNLCTEIFLFLFKSVLCAQVDLAQKRNCS